MPAPKTLKLKSMLRASSEAQVTVDPEKKTLEFSFSSEYPVERWFGREILSHDKGAADLSRMNDGAPLLWNHDPDKVLGVVEKAWIGEDKRGYVKARFSDSAFAQEKLKEVQDGILRNVSFAYRIKEMKLMNPESDAEPEYLGTKWLAYESSIVSIPADPTVGIGRALRAEQDLELEVRVINNNAAGVKERGMTEEEKKRLEEQRQAEATAAAGKIKDEAIKLERERHSAISALGAKFGKPDLARQLIENGTELQAARNAFLEEVGKGLKPVSEAGTDADLGLSKKDLKRYSFMRAIRAAAFPQEAEFQKEAAFEREVSAAALRQPGARELRGVGIRIPFEILRDVKDFQMRADLIAGTGSLGGHTVATDLLAASFIDLLRNKSVIKQAGATILNGLQGNIAIPRQTGGATAYYVAENSNLTESEQAFDQVTMNPKTVGAYSDFSRRLLLQSSIDVENLVKTDLAKVIALEVDRASLYGSGSSNQPTGLQNQAGSLGSVDFAADAPTYGEIIDMETAISNANADEGSLAFLTNAKGRGVLKKTLITATYGDRMIWGPDNLVNGYRPLVSNQVSRVSTGKEHYWLGNWSDLMIGFWSGLDLLTDPYAGALAGTVRVIAMQDFDVACRHPESFCIGSNLT